jgi:hypothetical protein
VGDVSNTLTDLHQDASKRQDRSDTPQWAKPDDTKDKKDKKDKKENFKKNAIKKIKLAIKSLEAEHNNCTRGRCVPCAFLKYHAECFALFQGDHFEKDFTEEDVLDTM